MSEASVVGTKGQVVIPVEVRRVLGIEPGQRVSVKAEGGKVVMYPLPRDLLRALRGRYAEGPSLTEALVREHAEELAKDDARFGPRVGAQ